MNELGVSNDISLFSLVIILFLADWLFAIQFMVQATCLVRGSARVSCFIVQNAVLLGSLARAAGSGSTQLRGPEFVAQCVE